MAVVPALPAAAVCLRRAGGALRVVQEHMTVHAVGTEPNSFAFLCSGSRDWIGFVILFIYFFFLEVGMAVVWLASRLRVN